MCSNNFYQTSRPQRHHTSWTGRHTISWGHEWSVTMETDELLPFHKSAAGDFLTSRQRRVWDWLEIYLPKMLSVSNMYMDRVKRIWYLSPMRAAKVQASLRIRAVSPEPSLLARSYKQWVKSNRKRQKARSLAPLNGWACTVKICHDGMLEDTNSLGAAHIMWKFLLGMQD